MAGGGLGMDALREFLEDLKRQGLDKGNWLGLLNVIIGRRIAKAGGQVISSGITWREMAAALKRVRWDKEAAREVGLDPDALPPRDRQQYWYTAITRARVDSSKASEEGDRVAEVLGKHGYEVGP